MTATTPPTLVFERNVGIVMADGTLLRANVFRPPQEGRYPVLMAMGAYGKDVHFEDAFHPQWQNLLKIYPELCSHGSSGQYLRWEVIDPERWVPEGYVVIQVDSRGTGQSPGYIDPFGPVETQDFYTCIEWAGVQPWSSGKVGLIGVSYLAMKQWQVAALRPPHLAAIVPWEGASDFYRDSGRHGGIFSNGFTYAWWPRQVLSNQHGSGDTPHRDRETQTRTTGPALSPAMLQGNRADHPNDRLQHPLDDAWVQERSPQLERIEVPVLSAANWGGPGMHLRGNVEGFLRAGSRHKWLFAHIGTHYESFYLPHYVKVQQRFFDHFLKGLDNGWDQEPPVQLAIRHAHGKATMRSETQWPLASTQWTRFHLDANRQTLDEQPPALQAASSYLAMTQSISFSTPRFSQDTEFTGPASLRLWVSSSTTDMDVFAVLRVFDANDQEEHFIGAHEKVPMALGWLRASHRKRDEARSRPHRPYHVHDEVQKLTPGERYPLDIEIWPTSMVFPAGYRLVLTLQGHDFEVTAPGRLLHNHPQDRPQEEFSGLNTVWTGADTDSYLLMPLIPAAQGN
jgi:predicted acyl esterase